MTSTSETPSSPRSVVARPFPRAGFSLFFRLEAGQRCLLVEGNMGSFGRVRPGTGSFLGVIPPGIPIDRSENGLEQPDQA